jgi:acyl-CoA synthetase (AMP-forming)/AMP-acid ligase II/acyl carrier protein
VTYGQLDRKARAVGAWLEASGATDQRVLLLFPSGIEYIVAFFGCLYARSVAVPAYPPRANRQPGRIQAIDNDCRPAVILTSSRFLPQTELLLGQTSGRRTIRLGAIENISDDLAEEWTEPLVEPDTLAFLQYTSGSTANPKGAMVSHGNVLENERLIQTAFRQDEQSIIVGWLPLFHDMGLIGNVLQTLYVGARCILFSPSTFLRNPAIWLRTISQYRATTSGGPNFAYELCTRRINAKDCELIDLSSWQTAFCGAEPIRKDTLERFAERFSPCGFRASAFCPAYGLAEATLFVAGGNAASGITSMTVGSDALKRNRLEPAITKDRDTRGLVSCGRVSPGLRVKIVDSTSLTECLNRQVGEVWVSGSSVAQGYWNMPDESHLSFNAHLADGDGPFLRTGDLGVLSDGELYIVGRQKDLIIIRGLNHHPQDIEASVENSHPGVHASSAVAFSTEIEGEERLIIVQEIERGYVDAAPREIIEAIRNCVATRHGVEAYGVVLAKPGTVPKTSSGKLQRSACRAAFLNGTLNVLETSFINPPTETVARLDEIRFRETVLALRSTEERRQELESYLQTEIARLLGGGPNRPKLQQLLTTLGLDSLKVMELQSRIETDLNVVLPMTDVLHAGSISQLASQLAVELEKQTSEPHSPPDSFAVDGADSLLSFGQQRLWFLDRFEPRNAAYNIAVPILIQGQVNAFAMEQAISEVAARHSVLRAVFRDTEGQPYQIVEAPGPIALPLVDGTSAPATDLRGWMMTLSSEEGQRPFDLTQGPLLRVRLLWAPVHEGMLLLTVHHIVSDGWSIGIFLDELRALYAAYLSGAPSPLPALRFQYSHFAFWQRRELQGEALTSQLSYWRQKFANPCPPLDLPVDRPRLASHAQGVSSHKLVLPSNLSSEIVRLSKRESCTLFVLLLAAFCALLHHYSEQNDISIGFPVAGRNRVRFKNLIGFFVNTLVLRADLSGNPTFRQLLSRVREETLQALANQDLPYEQLVSAVDLERRTDDSTLYRVWFGLRTGLGREIKLAGATMIPMDVDAQAAKVDLAVHFIADSECMTGKFEYRNDLFEARTVAGLAEDFRNLLAEAVCHPDRKLHFFEEVLHGRRQRQCAEAQAYRDALHDKLRRAQHEMNELGTEQSS